jgi:hypothetical protein
VKIRSGMVSNSSSASFTIPLDKITALQLKQILHYNEEVEKEGSHYSDSWDIRVKDDVVFGWTVIDNDYMARFLWDIGVPREVVDYSGD